MSNANAQSSIKVASSKKEVEKICCNFGKFTTDGKILVMEPEYAKSYMEPMMELDKPVKTYRVTVDSNGKVVKRTDLDGKEIKIKKLNKAEKQYEDR